MSSLEIFAVITGFLCVALTVKESVWCWPAGIVSCVAYTVVFFEVKLYAESALQLVFIALCVYGWYRWARPADGASELPVTRTSAGELVAVAAVCFASAVAIGWVLASRTDASLPYADAGLFAASLGAQWLLTRKKLENWMIWIAVDIVSVGVYVVKELHLTAALYVAFTALAVAGLLRWRRELR